MADSGEEYEYEDDDDYVYEDDDGAHGEEPASYRPPTDGDSKKADEETVVEFCSITSATPAKAEEYLGAAGHNLSNAIERYFVDVERGVQQPSDGMQMSAAPPAAPTDSAQKAASSSGTSNDDDGKTLCLLTLWAHGYSMSVKGQLLWEGKQQDYTDKLGKEIIVALDKK